MNLVTVKTDFRATVALVVTATETPIATARVHHIEGILTDVRNCHHAGSPLITALNASLTALETGSDGTAVPGDRYLLVNVGNGAGG